jgi:hypothetical protein
MCFHISRCSGACLITYCLALLLSLERLRFMITIIIHQENLYVLNQSQSCLNTNQEHFKALFFKTRSRQVRFLIWSWLFLKLGYLKAPCKSAQVNNQESEEVQFKRGKQGKQVFVSDYKSKAAKSSKIRVVQQVFKQNKMSNQLMY